MATDSDLISVKRFGDVEVALLHAGHIHWGPTDFPGDWRTPDLPLDDEGRAIMGVNTMVVRTPDAIVVVDPVSIGPTDSTAPWSDLIAGPSLDEGLVALGLDRHDVTHVVVTHGHPDHYLGVLLEPREDGIPRFPNAEHLFPADDWERFVAHPADLPAGHSHLKAPELMKPIEAAGRVRQVTGDLELAPGVRVIHTPGETAGHQMLRVETPDGPVLHLGDLFHLPAELANPTWTPLKRDYAGLVESRTRVLGEAAAENATVVLTHGRFPPWGSIEEIEPGRYRWQYA